MTSGITMLCLFLHPKTYRDLHHRLCKKLEEAKASGQSVEMEEEFRKLTLQIIGQAFLSLPPDECDRVRSS